MHLLPHHLLPRVAIRKPLAIQRVESSFLMHLSCIIIHENLDYIYMYFVLLFYAFSVILFSLHTRMLN